MHPRRKQPTIDHQPTDKFYLNALKLLNNDSIPLEKRCNLADHAWTNILVYIPGNRKRILLDWLQTQLLTEWKSSVAWHLLRRFLSSLDCFTSSKYFHMCTGLEMSFLIIVSASPLDVKLFGLVVEVMALVSKYFSSLNAIKLPTSRDLALNIISTQSSDRLKMAHEDEVVKQLLYSIVRQFKLNKTEAFRFLSVDHSCSQFDNRLVESMLELAFPDLPKFLTECRKNLLVDVCRINPTYLKEIVDICCSAPSHYENVMEKLLNQCRPKSIGRNQLSVIASRFPALALKTITINSSIFAYLPSEMQAQHVFKEHYIRESVDLPLSEVIDVVMRHIDVSVDSEAGEGVLREIRKRASQTDRASVINAIELCSLKAYVKLKFAILGEANIENVACVPATRKRLSQSIGLPESDALVDPFHDHHLAKMYIMMRDPKHVEDVKVVDEGTGNGLYSMELHAFNTGQALSKEHAKQLLDSIDNTVDLQPYIRLVLSTCHGKSIRKAFLNRWVNQCLQKPESFHASVFGQRKQDLLYFIAEYLHCAERSSDHHIHRSIVSQLSHCSMPPSLAFKLIRSAEDASAISRLFRTCMMEIIDLESLHMVVSKLKAGNMNSMVLADMLALYFIKTKLFDLIDGISDLLHPEVMFRMLAKLSRRMGKHQLRKLIKDNLATDGPSLNTIWTLDESTLRSLRKKMDKVTRKVFFSDPLLGDSSFKIDPEAINRIICFECRHPDRLDFSRMSFVVRHHGKSIEAAAKTALLNSLMITTEPQSDDSFCELANSMLLSFPKRWRKLPASVIAVYGHVIDHLLSRDKNFQASQLLSSLLSIFRDVETKPTPLSAFTILLMRLVQRLSSASGKRDQLTDQRSLDLLAVRAAAIERMCLQIIPKTHRKLLAHCSGCASRQYNYRYIHVKLNKLMDDFRNTAQFKGKI